MGKQFVSSYILIAEQYIKDEFIMLLFAKTMLIGE